MKLTACLVAVLLPMVTPFVLPRGQQCKLPLLAATPSPSNEDSLLHQRRTNDVTTRWLASATLASTLFLASASGPVARAYDPTDYASETVQSTIKALQDSAGDADATYKVYEEMNSIITEGKGVGGSINYKGVQLDRGYVADEDTSIYNPGLTLLTESEKERLVEAVIQNRKVALQKGDWSETNQLAFEFLREKLDPFHVTELQGYLGILPFYAAAVYMAVLAVQQFLRDLFPVAYIVGVVAIFAPALILLALGPQ